MPFVENEVSVNSNGGTELISRHLQSILPPDLTEDFQIIPSRVRELHEDKIRVVFFNDLPNDPEVKNFAQESYRKKFHHFVFISDWQREAFQQHLGFPYDQRSSVIEVGFEPIEVDWEKKKNDKIKFVYTSTPQRGLELLVPVFDQVSKMNPNVHLDVFSSFKIYGWEEMDKKFATLYDQIRNHPNMTYRGFTPNEEVRNHLAESHIFAYPSIWPETSCRAMEEAMSAGLICVHPNFAALPLTSGGLNMMYQGSSDPKEHMQVFGSNLMNAIELLKNDNITDYLKYVKSYADNRYNINKIQSVWTNLLTELKNRFPSGQRSPSKDDSFVFDTTRMFR